VLEPTCGLGRFLETAAVHFPGAALVGRDVNPEYVAYARAALSTSVDAPGETAQRPVDLAVADFFGTDWASVLDGLQAPLLVLGNPPWVTNSTLGGLGAHNAPTKHNRRGLSGMDARTGKSNFDISEWMLLRLLEALNGREFLLAMLCKLAVARKVLEHVVGAGWPVQGEVFRVDAEAHFGASVPAALLVLYPKTSAERSASSAVEWPVYADLSGRELSGYLGMVGRTPCSDVVKFERTARWDGGGLRAWRSGLKHDLASVMELRRQRGGLVNGLGELVELESETLFPLLKGSDLANGRGAGERFLVVPQRVLGEDTTRLEQEAPRTWAYLMRHAERFAARKSSIYSNQPPFSVFGVGRYAFASHKVAISGLYKRLNFRVLGPYEGKPVLLDDTCYFLPCEDEAEALRICAALNGPDARDYFEARLFWDAKRPVNKALLQGLRWDQLLADADADAAQSAQLAPVSAAEPSTMHEASFSQPHPSPSGSTDADEQTA
jgi:hypothetical protein